MTPPTPTDHRSPWYEAFTPQTPTDTPRVLAPEAEETPAAPADWEADDEPWVTEAIFRFYND